MKKNINFRDPQIRNAVLIVVIGLLAAGYMYYQFIAPVSATLAGLQSELSMKQTQLNQIQTLKTRLARLKEEVVQDSVVLDSLRQKFPDRKEIPRLIHELTKVSSACGITTTKFQPLPDVIKEYYIENRYLLAIEGGYHELAEYFSYLANMPLIINLGTVAIKTNPALIKPQQQRRPGLQQMQQPEEVTVVEEQNSIVATFELTTFSSKK